MPKQPVARMWLEQSCFLCGASCADLLCPACRADLPWYSGPACRRCALPLPAAGLELCGACLAQAPPQSRTLAAFAYAYPLNRLILAAKYHHHLALLGWLGRAMSERLRTVAPPDVIIPVPLNDAGLRRRGYNQALELAKAVAHCHHLPLAHDACRCVGKKREQASLPARERAQNVRGVYRVHRLAPHWRRVAIVDDVMTTGATVAELARTLLRAGVEEVDAWCCARNLP